MRIVVDANVVIKWFVSEAGRTEALSLLQGDDDLSAPDLVVPEVTNIAWKKALRSEIGVAQARLVVAGLASLDITLVPSLELRERALEIGLALRHPTYDCLYVAAAERLDGILVTADRRLHAVTRTPAFREIVRPLSEPTAP